MPGFNQKGPSGEGAMTGRKMGKCTNYGAGKNVSSNDEPSANGQGLGLGRGRGRGMGCGMGRGRRGRNGAGQ